MKEDWRIEEREGEENFGNKDAMCQFSGKTKCEYCISGGGKPEAASAGFVETGSSEKTGKGCARGQKSEKEQLVTINDSQHVETQ